jgi:hypothetical protein
MAEKKESFTVTDRRLFTPEGELRKESSDEVNVPQAARPTQAPKPPSSEAKSEQPPSPIEMPSQDTRPAALETAQTDEADVPLTPDEQQAGADAYKQSSKDLDTRVELSGHSAKDLEMTFERFMASLYMTAMVQLGLMREQSANPAVDLIGARQTIDTLSIVAEKTKGNLTPTESNFLQNCLYELRMAYVEVTNALSRSPQAADPKISAR